MPSNANRRIVEDYFTAWTKGDAKRLNKIVSDEFSFNNPAPGMTPDKAGLIEMSKVFSAAFPDMKFKASHWVVEGDRVAARFVAKATHRGDLMGIPPTGKKVEIGVVAIATVRDGQVVEEISEFDAMGMFMQIGQFPQLETHTA